MVDMEHEFFITEARMEAYNRAVNIYEATLAIEDVRAYHEEYLKKIKSEMYVIGVTIKNETRFFYGYGKKNQAKTSFMLAAAKTYSLTPGANAEIEKLIALRKKAFLIKIKIEQ